MRPRAERTTPDPARPRPLFRVDAGWLLLVPGLALLSAVTLAPAWVDLAEVRDRRDRELAVERHARERNHRYEVFVAALDRRDPDLLDRLATVHFNTLPDGRSPLPGLELTETGADRLPDADVSQWLEPPPPVRPSPTRREALPETVETLASFGPRLWLIGLGGSLVIAGLLTGLRPAEPVA